MAGFVLRLKTKSGQKVVNDLSPQDKVSRMKTELAEVTGIPAAALHVLSGFPPKVIDLSADRTIQEIGIISGDTLIVEERPVCRNGQPPKPADIGRSRIVHEETLTSGPGVLMRKIVPADNSCLFTSIGYVLNHKVDPTCSTLMREIIASSVAADEAEYSEAILGKPNDQYCKWILKPDSWGGAIELSILSKFYGLEIAVVDSVNAIVNRFGEDQRYGQRVFLIFDGIHYDPLYLESLDGRSIQTMFPADDERMLSQAAELAREAKSSRQFTDVQKFTLVCNYCKIMLNGQLAAQRHAQETGHTSFGEVAA